MYKIKKIGPSTEPWGTPQSRWTTEELEALRRTYWVQPSTYDRNHFKAHLQSLEKDVVVDRVGRRREIKKGESCKVPVVNS